MKDMLIGMGVGVILPGVGSNVLRFKCDVAFQCELSLSLVFILFLGCLHLSKACVSPF